MRPVSASLACIIALAGALGGCGSYGYYGPGYDQYGNPIPGYQDPNAYGSSSYSSYGSYGSSYSSYDSSYSSSYSSYPTTATTTGTTTTTVDPNTGIATTTTTANGATGVGVAQSGGPTAQAAATVLSAYVKDTKKTGFLGLSGLVAHVEVTNPTSITLSGTLHVLFTDDGHPSGTEQTRLVTLKPLETQVLTFTASSMLLNDAEATIDTIIQNTLTQSTVVDRK